MIAVYPYARDTEAARRFNVMEPAAGGMDPIITRDSSLPLEVLEMAEVPLVACDPLRRDDEIRAKLLAIKIELRRTMHDPIAKTGAWIKRMLQGHLNYFAVSGNHPSL
jgi:hypothetical protein